nr:immunoglobulin light chain junction region [Macaca mulatta]
CQQYNDLLWTF